MSEQEYLSVSMLERYIGRKFTKDPYLQDVFVKGEVTNLRASNARTRFFALKDETAQINVTLFANVANKLNFELKNGDEVCVIGKIGVYEANGSYSLIPKSMKLAGHGELHEQLLLLKEKLSKEGLFNFQPKPLPKYPEHVAVVTSQKGAVIHDIIQTFELNYPLTKLTLFPVVVQGEKAAPSMIQALQKIQACADEFDAVIIGRGGGSFEDLFCFNDEALVRAVVAMTIPVVSSIGHHEDHSLVDDVADQCVSTPTQAVTVLTGKKEDILANLYRYRQMMTQQMDRKIHTLTERVKQLTQHPVLSDTNRVYQNKQMNVRNQTLRLKQAMRLIQTNKANSYRTLKVQLEKQSPQHYLENLMQKQAYLMDALTQKIDQVYQRKKNRLERLQSQLVALDSTAVMQRGYAYVTTESGKTLINSQDVQQGDELIIHLAHGTLHVTVTKREDEK